MNRNTIVSANNLVPALGSGSDALDYRTLAQLHAPADITSAMRDLAKQGLKARDIASALRIGERQVLEALKDAPMRSSA